MKVRNEFLDFMKGIAIILVVIGHCIQLSYGEFDSNLIFRVIYSFHMPLFMFLAGASAKISGGGGICHKFVSLVVPFLSWYGVNAFLSNMQIGWGTYMKELICGVSSGLWFLWVLFLNYLTLWMFTVLFAILFKNKVKDIKQNEKYPVYIKIICMIWILLLLVSRLFQTSEFLGFNLYQHHCMWFLLGYLYFEGIEKRIKAVYKNRISIYQYMVILPFIFLAVGWNRIGNPIFYDRIFKNSTISIAVIQGIIYLYKIIVPLLGIMTALIVGNRLWNQSITKEQILYLGKNTLAIYALHMFFIINGELFNIGVFNIIGKSIISIVMSIVAALIIKHSKGARLLLLGIPRIEKSRK